MRRKLVFMRKLERRLKAQTDYFMLPERSGVEPKGWLACRFDDPIPLLPARQSPKASLTQLGSFTGATPSAQFRLPESASRTGLAYLLVAQLPSFLSDALGAVSERQHTVDPQTSRHHGLARRLRAAQHLLNHLQPIADRAIYGSGFS